MKKGFYRFLLTLFGWKIEGKKPTDIKKYIIVVAPHTSNYDFFLGVATRAITGLNSYYLAKKELFAIPVLGWMFKAIGGIPVDRSKKSNMVDQVTT
ncbi:MAG: 1-acyl-sn-glycerol-3-phosphate acyltransferase, partial [Cyclobacteriaceae bacterium]